MHMIYYSHRWTSRSSTFSQDSCIHPALYWGSRCYGPVNIAPKFGLSTFGLGAQIRQLTEGCKHCSRLNDQSSQGELPIKPLNVLEVQNNELNIDPLKKSRRENKTLDKFWKMLLTESHEDNGRFSHKFKIKKDVLFRVFEQTRKVINRSYKS